MGAVFSSAVPETDIEGYHILDIHKNSPADSTDLEAFFDFIVALCGVVLIGNNDVFMELLHRHRNQLIDLKIYSLRNNTFRNVQITPSADWEGDGLLGLTINFCSVKEACNNIHHVLKVEPHSPAGLAGLNAVSDYIYGAETKDDDEKSNFTSLIKVYDQRALKLFVYNMEEDSCRSIIIKPDSQWNGSGALGCDFGTGVMHRIPTKKESESIELGLLQPRSENNLSRGGSVVKSQQYPSKLRTNQSSSDSSNAQTTNASENSFHPGQPLEKKTKCKETLV